MENPFFQAFATIQLFCSKPNNQNKGYKDCMKNNCCISLSVAKQWLSLNTLTENGDLFMARFSPRKQAWFIIDQVYWKAKKKLLIRK